jgi:hypothetical protein
MAHWHKLNCVEYMAGGPHIGLCVPGISAVLVDLGLGATIYKPTAQAI